jgi:outer membrane protein OmpA-like peptidoglycan-associated protein
MPVTGVAQSSELAAGEAAIFAPQVQACIAAPTGGECGEVFDLIGNCAESLEQSRCAVLFENAEEVFADPAELERARLVLVEASATFADTDRTLAPDDPDDASAPEATEMDAVEGEDAETQAEVAEEAQPALEAIAEAVTEPEELDNDEGAGNGVVEDEQPAEAVDALTEAEAEDDAEAAADTGSEPEDETEARLREALREAEESADGATANVTEDETTADTDQPQFEAPSDDAAASDDDTVEEERAQLRAEAEAMAEEAPELVVAEAPDEEFVAPADAPRELDEAQRSALEQLMEDPEIAAAVAQLGGTGEGTDDNETPVQQPAAVAAALAALARAGRDEDAEDEPAEAAEATEVTEDEVAADEVRASRDDFVSRFALDFDPEQVRRDDRRRDLERAGLAALAGVAVGMMINRNRVVARADERVVVQRDDGQYDVWRDDDAILRQEGAQRRIERYADGSTLTRWDQPDGSRVMTIRDATGRVLWRERILPDGLRIELVNDMREIDPIDLSLLPPLRTRELRISQRTDPELALALLREAETDARALDRSFTLRQVREVREVRELVPVLSPEPITFETNRANVRPSEAPKLAQVGRLIERLIAEDPREVFLVEGHTDATGPASYNLALSDRRAESVALALTEFFDIPPENLIIQGFGERHLRIPTAAAEERNRRVAIRRITPLLGL